MRTVLLWLMPPIIGAAIGYITNAIAIKMLFRPLEEVHLGKWRLPFTPGILPRQRRQLAQSIGRMVERELLTPEIVRARLVREDVRVSVKNGVANFTDKLLSIRITELSLDKTNPVIGGVLKSFFRSPIFISIFDDVFGFIIENVGDIERNEFLNKNIREILGSERITVLEKRVSGTMSTYITANSSVISEQITVIFANSFMQIVDACTNFLRRDDVRRELETHGRIFLNNTIRKLSATQRFFLSVGQYNERLSERMPEIIDDLIRQIYTLFSDDETRQRLLTFFTDNTERFLADNGARIADVVTGFLSTQINKPLKEFLKGVKKEDVRLLGREILNFIRSSLNTSPVFTGFFKKMLEKHRDLVIASFFPITTEQKDALDTIIAEKFLLIADEQIGNVLSSINVTTLVADRIDELDMIQVERIILDIMANQLKWINVFGAILGAFIGVFQSLFSWLVK
ncbi:MAG: DUF445 family protein [Treponema sp.]|jgi:uncharacterized membrane protein YheB (UPF0754 family)|nr:DUF445 family protein [Treponema sp.]